MLSTMIASVKGETAIILEKIKNVTFILKLLLIDRGRKG